MKNFIHRTLVALLSSIRPVHAIDPAQIGCIELSRMGDVLAMLPALRLLRASFPSSKITVVVQQSYAEFLRRLAIVDEVIGIGNRSIHQTVHILRDRNVTLTCSMSPATTNACCALLGARAAIGYLGPPLTLPGILDRNAVTGIGAEIIREEFHMENLYTRGVKICRSLGITDEPQSSNITIDSDWENTSLDVLRALDLTTHSDYIVLHPFAGWEFRAWPAERWRQMLEILIRATPNECVLISSKGERTRLETIAKENHRVRYAVGLPMEHLAVLLKRSAGYIGNDSGPLHVAAALGVPTVGLFGPAAPKFTGPPGDHSAYLFRQLECSPCSQQRCVRPHNSCMMQLDTESVLDAIEKLFGPTYVQSRGHGS
jgi:ADP-heptose:LPS heptosyltransferase